MVNFNARGLSSRTAYLVPNFIIAQLQFWLMSQKIETLQQTISRMGTDSYTARDAKRDQMLANERINRLKVRVDRLELKVEEK